MPEVWSAEQDVDEERARRLVLRRFPGSQPTK
jgi:hypothetical protein